MTKQCAICGAEFEAKSSRAMLCSDLCRKLNRQAYMSAYQPKRREYNRLWMRRYREALGKDEVNRRQRDARKPKTDTIIGLDYAERQKQRTLELVGRVQI